MDEYSAHEFEVELRKYCDLMFDRPPPAESTLMPSILRKHTLEQIREYWGRRWGLYIAGSFAVFAGIAIPLGTAIRFVQFVPRWGEWNPDIERISLDGPFAAGSTITMTPLGQDPVELEIAEAVEPERFVDEADLGEVVVRTLHEVV